MLRQRCRPRRADCRSWQSVGDRGRLPQALRVLSVCALRRRGQSQARRSPRCCPPTVLSAKFSLPHALAAVAARRTGGQAAFARDTLDDPVIARLRQTVRLRLYDAIGPWPKDRPARVTWRLKDGETWSEAVQSARGGA